LVEEGKFRKDLFYRINVVKITLPKLAERKEGIPLLAEHFIEALQQVAGQKNRGIKL
jgi:transcriptional regulator with PAS, ATPase and Fis domain